MFEYELQAKTNIRSRNAPISALPPIHPNTMKTRVAADRSIVSLFVQIKGQRSGIGDDKITPRNKGRFQA